MKYEVMKTIPTPDGEVSKPICTARDEHEAEILVDVLQDGHAKYNSGTAKYWYRKATNGNDT